MTRARPRRPPGSGSGPHRLGESIGEVVDGLGGPAAAASLAVFRRWEEVVGPDVAAHVRPVRVTGTALVVAADHPAWATQVRVLAGALLARIEQLGVSAPDRIEVVVQRP
ncbi:MAG TPA: DUF721 domain-containing protein [Acidimicrobiales bacterium]|nr:DUF721 domain-containing protein [Acidimicrobiales bacterium]